MTLAEWCRCQHSSHKRDQLTTANKLTNAAAFNTLITWTLQRLCSVCFTSKALLLLSALHSDRPPLELTAQQRGRSHRWTQYANNTAERTASFCCPHTHTTIRLFQIQSFIHWCCQHFFRIKRLQVVYLSFQPFLMLDFSRLRTQWD